MTDKYIVKDGQTIMIPHEDNQTEPEPRKPINLTEASIEVFRAAMAWACNLGYRHAQQGKLALASKQVLDAYPFTANITDERSLYAAYCGGRDHYSYGSRPGASKPPVHGNPADEVRIVAQQEPPKALDPINFQRDLPDRAAPATVSEITNTSLPVVGRPKILG